MKKFNIYTVCFLFGMFVFSGCQDVIDVDLNFENAQLVVDAWVDNRAQDQKIRLTLSQEYLNSAIAEGVTGAEIKVSNGGNIEHIFEDQGNGDYIWTSNGQTLGSIGDEMTLQIFVNGKEYLGTNRINRVPEIDSISQETRVDELIFTDGIYAQLYARDLPGIGDTYWAKTYKNGQFLNKPLELLIIYDATFDAGSGLDGVTFIPPLREAINPIPDDLEEGEEAKAPYEVGDEIRVELVSISNDAFRFLQIAQEQMTNGLNTIFALPVANTKSNVFDQETEEPILGFFNVGAVSEIVKVIE